MTIEKYIHGTLWIFSDKNLMSPISIIAQVRHHFTELTMSKIDFKLREQGMVTFSWGREVNYCIREYAYRK